MRFGMQVKVKGRWEDVRPTGGESYRYGTREEASAMLRMCYPGLQERGEARVSVHDRAHCRRDPAAIGACGGTDATCSCECFPCTGEEP